jgi:ankyrin repeat protein
MSSMTDNLKRKMEQLEAGTLSPHEAGTALRMAAVLKDLESMRSLVNAGVDVNAREEAFGTTPLLVAVEGDTAVNESTHEQVQLLLDAGAVASLEEKNEEGHTALYVAAGSNKVETVNALLQAGADVNATNNFGTTPLMKASSLGFDGCVAALLDAGADASARNSYGKTALSLALPSSQSRTLIEVELSRRAAQERAARAGSLESLYAAIDAPAEPVAPRPPRVRQRC